MSSSSIGLDQALQDYLLQVSLSEPGSCEKLRLETLELPEAAMISSPEQIQLLLLLFKMLGARNGLEIGTFTGYTSLRLTLGIPELKMVCCDVSEQFTNLGRKYWNSAGVDERIELKLAPAEETLDQLIDAGGSGSFDFAYIDADKTGYRNYVESCLDLVRSGGLIAIDNVLWNGSVVDADDKSADTVALRDLNLWLHQQAPGKFDLSLVPIGDGLTLLRKF